MKKIFCIFTTILTAIFASSSVFADSTIMDGMEDVGVSNCVNVHVVYSRGSGAPYGRSEEYEKLTYSAMKFAGSRHISTVVTDLAYPAIELSSPQRILGAYVSAGRAYEFGQSVKDGIENLKSYYHARIKECPSEKWVFVGYSQGAMAVTGAASEFDADRVAFIMLIADPETYLPEGGGLFPDACRGKNFSSWRTFVPNCRTHKGAFGGRNPYEASGLEGKYSLWCNRFDYVCGSSKNPLVNSGHLTYASSGTIDWGYTYLAKMYLADVGKPESLLRAKSVAEEDDFSINEQYDDGAPVDADASGDVISEIVGDVMYLKWQLPNNAKYLLIRLNGFDLGYVDAGLGEFEIHDIDRNDPNNLYVAWMAEDGEFCVGNIDSETAIGDVGGPNDTAISPVYPVTSTSVASMDNNEVDLIDTNDFLSNLIINKPSESIYRPPTQTAARGISRAEKSSIVNVILALFGASGLLIVFVVRHRRGE